jgi:2,3-bisphosphoglycerate-independent phosphoglycerate mutase
LKISKLIFVVIDGMADLPIKQLGNKTPLEAADTPNLDSLAKQGQTGLMYTVKKGVAPESDVAVLSILGYDPFKYHTGRGILEAIGADVALSNGDLALRCNFATMGDGNELLDRRAGRDLTQTETAELSKAINASVDLVSHPVDFEFRSTIGHRGVLVVRSKADSLSGNITNTDPAYSRQEGLGVAKRSVDMVLKECLPLDDTDEAETSANLVNEFVEKSRNVLDRHRVNERRVAEGKLKANVILTRDAGHIVPKLPNIDKKYGVQFVSLTDMPVERGIAELAGMRSSGLPPPSGNLVEDCGVRVRKLLGLLESFDCFYVHIKGPDEPGHDGDLDLKRQMISIIDEHLLGHLLKKISLKGFVLCVTADHATPCELKAHSDDPVPVLVAGGNVEPDDVDVFSERSCKKGDLGTIRKGIELMPRLIGFLKA